MTKLSNQSRFSNVTIEGCLERLQKLYKIKKDNEMDNAELYKYMGLSIKSGYANRLIAAMKYYGFIEKKETKFLISDVAKIYIKNKKLTLNEFKYCLSNIPIYSLILDDHSFDEIMHNKFDIKSYLIKNNDYTKSQIEGFLKIHEENIRFILQQPTARKAIDNNKGKNILNEDINEIVTVEKNGKNEICQIVLPLGNGENIEFTYPEDMTNEQLDIVLNFSMEYIKRILSSKYTNKK